MSAKDEPCCPGYGVVGRCCAATLRDRGAKAKLATASIDTTRLGEGAKATLPIVYAVEDALRKLGLRTSIDRVGAIFSLHVSTAKTQDEHENLVHDDEDA